MHQKNENGTFTSKIGFVLAAVGSAVGMGNIWMFPYRTGQYGGAAFLIPYLLFIALFGYVGLSGEFAFGRMTGTGPIGSYEFAMKSRGKKGGAILGTIPLLGSLGIAIGYAIIVGWVLRSAFGALTGSLMSTEPEQFFTEMSSTDFSSVPWHTLVILLTAAVLIFGVSGGIEKINKVMMPAFFILFIIIAVRVAFLPNAIEGYKYLLVPQWEYLLNPRTWIMAMGQAFFSLSITGSGMIIYGSYLPRNEDVVHSSCMTAVLDTCAAMLAGLAILPSVFAFGLDPASGPKLLFITLQDVFNAMGTAGPLFGVLFYLLVSLAAITSAIALTEVMVTFFLDHAALKGHKPNRSRIVGLVCLAVMAVSTLVAVDGLGSNGLWVPFHQTGRNLAASWLDFMDFISEGVAMPLGALIMTLLVGWKIGPGTIRDEVMERDNPFSPRLYRFYIFAIRVIAPIGMAFILYGQLAQFFTVTVA